MQSCQAVFRHEIANDAAIFNSELCSTYSCCIVPIPTLLHMLENGLLRGKVISGVCSASVICSRLNLYFKRRRFMWPLKKDKLSASLVHDLIMKMWESFSMFSRYSCFHHFSIRRYSVWRVGSTDEDADSFIKFHPRQFMTPLLTTCPIKGPENTDIYSVNYIISGMLAGREVLERSSATNHYSLTH